MNDAVDQTAVRESDEVDRRRGKAAFFAGLALDAGLPLAVYYGLRAAGASAWLALVVGGAASLVRLAYVMVRRREVSQVSLFSLSILVAGTLVGLLTGDPRLLLARESYLTAIVGLWILCSLFRPHPVIFTATLAVMPPDQAAEWRRKWDDEPRFRRLWKQMTVWWALAFLIDSAARIVMAYTLPVDIVPIAGAVLLVVLLTIVVQGTKAYGRRSLRDTPEPPAG
ncbi:VC0807 family protein [Kribbella sp. NPDC048915]|uniref:VC0807 family protein n=1 Tax=Kribbella sp. NPDC048915 TaxID=3155148 RepID=UPI003410AEFA